MFGGGRPAGGCLAAWSLPRCRPSGTRRWRSGTVLQGCVAPHPDAPAASAPGGGVHRAGRVKAPIQAGGAVGQEVEAHDRSQGQRRPAPPAEQGGSARRQGQPGLQAQGPGAGLGRHARRRGGPQPGQPGEEDTDRDQRAQGRPPASQGVQAIAGEDGQGQRPQEQGAVGHMQRDEPGYHRIGQAPQGRPVTQAQGQRHSRRPQGEPELRAAGVQGAGQGQSQDGTPGEGPADLGVRAGNAEEVGQADAPWAGGLGRREAPAAL